MATIQIQINRKTMMIGLAFVALAGASGFGGAKLAGHVGSSAQTSGTPTVASPTPPHPQQSPLQGTGSPWGALQPLSASWMSQALSAKLLTSTAGATSLSSDKPILITAYWCGFCHEELQLLAKNHLLNKVQVVGVSFEGQDTGQKSATITNVQQASTAYASALRSINVSLSTTSILYAMPKTQLDTLVTQFPLLLVPHDGKWYYLNGYSPNASLFHQVLNG